MTLKITNLTYSSCKDNGYCVEWLSGKPTSVMSCVLWPSSRRLLSLNPHDEALLLKSLNKFQLGFILAHLDIPFCIKAKGLVFPKLGSLNKWEIAKTAVGDWHTAMPLSLSPLTKLLRGIHLKTQFSLWHEQTFRLHSPLYRGGDVHLVPDVIPELGDRMYMRRVGRRERHRRKEGAWSLPHFQT